MIFLLVLAVAAAVIFALYRWLTTGAPSRRSAASVLAVGIALGAIRAAMTGIGFYVAEHTAGPWQGPAFAIALAGWPEIALLGSHRGVATPAFYGRMAALLVVTSTAAVALIAFAARRRGGAR
ncbi:MAG TPA: hypothetical protein VF128_08775 [Gemmatimonadaceae bacterium]